MNRRDLLKTAGGALVVSMIPRELFATGANVSPLMTTLSEYMASAGGRALPDGVVEKTKHMILDTLAAAISGSDLPPGKFAIKFARAYGGEKVSTVVASNIVCGPIEAALANGMLAHPGGARRGRETRHRWAAAHARGRAWLRRRHARHGDAREAAVHGRHPSQHACAGRHVWIRGRGWLCCQSERAANAMAFVIYGPAGLRPCVVAARHRARREGIRLRRNAGEKRRHRGEAGRR